jgi:DNA polymerase delta subunit 1
LIFIKSGIFPEPDKDPVIQIANMVIRQGEKDPFIRNVFTFKSCAPIVGAEVLSFETEQELLRVSHCFQKLITLWCPVIHGRF